MDWRTGIITIWYREDTQPKHFDENFCFSETRASVGFYYFRKLSNIKVGITMLVKITVSRIN